MVDCGYCINRYACIDEMEFDCKSSDYKHYSGFSGRNIKMKTINDKMKELNKHLNIDFFNKSVDNGNIKITINDTNVKIENMLRLAYGCQESGHNWRKIEGSRVVQCSKCGAKAMRNVAYMDEKNRR